MTLGTSGHVDHGKTALVKALTGIDTDRLPDERRRGLSIELGFAPLTLPSGRRLSLIDVPGHERFVRTMVAGSTGIDLYLLVIAADDGVMPQTLEHWVVLQALEVPVGVVAITKTDLADPAPATAQARELVGDGVEIVACSARTGAGLEALVGALERAAAAAATRTRDRGGEPVLHIDRAFHVRGAGSVVTGSLWSGTLATRDALRVLPQGLRARVRGLQVHDAPVERADAGQRVAVNLTGVALQQLERGQALVGESSEIRPSWILDAQLDLVEPPAAGDAQVHHGTRETRARLVALGGGYWQLRTQRPLLARAGDHLVVRSTSTPATLGGGTVLDPRARRRGPGPAAVARLERLRRGEPEPGPPPSAEELAPAVAMVPAPLDEAALALEATLREAGHEPPLDSQLGAVGAELAALREAGRIVRLGRAMHAHVDAVDAVRERVVALIEAEGGVTLARLRDDLSTSRRYAQALLEHMDATQVTLRLPDDRRVLRRRRG